MNRKNLAPSSIFKSDVFGFSQGVLVEEGRKQLFISGQLAADKNGNFLAKIFQLYDVSIPRVFLTHVSKFPSMNVVSECEYKIT